MTYATPSLTSLALALALLAATGAAGSAAAQSGAPAPAGAPLQAPAAVPGQTPAPATAPISKPAPVLAPVVKPAPATAAPGTVKAAPLGDKLLWKDLSRPQQLALDPLKGEWDNMETARKQKWVDIANRYSSMKPDEQLRVQERMRDWIKLTPAERRLARENYTLSKKLDKSKKSVEWEKYQQLPDEEKKKLALDAAVAKKQVTNLPPTTQTKPVAPTKPPAACPPGTIRNAPAAVPRCIASPSAGAPLAVPATPPATISPITPPAPPAAPVSNAK
ncbi:DUF3106 domain-containing protein [Massilia antarctica]|uniref:DUF3106 domain-containing protein n=1 Tax=Massilia antarctica TaxID=2765360 RepID=A0AA48WCB5_9BURK|nr:DUF3106 domain-containing protein [Massilia antarctica]QPI49782.1 DUF3106 domain-containing protein [Massilia antarctica]